MPKLRMCHYGMLRLLSGYQLVGLQSMVEVYRGFPFQSAVQQSSWLNAIGADNMPIARNCQACVPYLCERASIIYTPV